MVNKLARNPSGAQSDTVRSQVIITECFRLLETACGQQLARNPSGVQSDTVRSQVIITE